MSTPRLHVDRRARQFRGLTEVSRALTYAVTLKQVLELAVERAAELLEADQAVLMLANDDGLLSIRASHGVAAALSERFREPLQETIATRLQGLFRASGNEHFVAVPLVVAGEVTGLLAVSREAQSTGLEEEEWLLSALADQAAVALEKTRLDETAVFRERLIGIVSHDLRNPITAIVMSTELLLRREGLDGPMEKSLLRIERSAARAARMIEDLLDYTQTKLGSGIQIHPQPADLHSIVRQVVEELHVTYPDRQIDFQLAGNGVGDWDLDRLAQVLSNLLSNALQYSQAGSNVRVETSGTDDGVTLTVHNVGAVIPPDRLPHVFEPMMRATSDVTNAGRSVGLGLYIVKSIVDSHDGKIAVQSTAEAGTLFTVQLPRRRPYP